MATVPKLPPEWYHRRFQAVGRAQSRYFLLSLLVAAYTFGLSYTPDDTVNVTILGLSHVPRAIVNAAATVVLSILLLALFGSLQAAREAGAELRARLSDDNVTQVPWHVIDEHPNVADFVGYANHKGGMPRARPPFGVLVFYPLPVIAFVVWNVLLWRQGFIAPTLEPGWLDWVYDACTFLVFAVLWCTAEFVRRRLELFRTGS
jgi:hypothetical protein